jgi:hypothetical protein
MELRENNEKIIIEYKESLLNLETKFELINKTQKEVNFFFNYLISISTI